jgi:hypothetical protein
VDAADRLVRSYPMPAENFRAFSIATELKTESGKTIDLGTFDVTTGKPAKGVR